MSLSALRATLHAAGDADAARKAQRFFKTGPGEYAQGDRFIGVSVPVLRVLAGQHATLPQRAILRLLRSAVHEERLLALLLWVAQFERADKSQRREIYRAYLAHSAYVNNWDLVDCSAHKIVGAYLLDKSRRPLYRLAKSKTLWQRRIAMMSTYCFIKAHDFDDALALAEQLLQDEHDLIHKVVGWMLREIGKREPAVQEAFLRRHYQVMPRTMLRYAIEKFPPALRQRYLKGRI